MFACINKVESDRMSSWIQNYCQAGAIGGEQMQGMYLSGNSHAISVPNMASNGDHHAFVMETFLQKLWCSIASASTRSILVWLLPLRGSEDTSF